MKKADELRLEALKVSESELQKKFSEADLFGSFASLKEESASILSKVEFPEMPSHGALSLLMLYLCKGKLLHKDDIARVGSYFLGENQTDWQVRHLAAQKGFWILGKGDLIPNTNLQCPSGYHMLITLDGVSPKYAAIKRVDLLNESDFEVVKKSFGSRCAHCSSKEGDNNYRDSTKTVLQKGHIDPNRALDVGNIIPLCDYCNRTYKDTYIFLPNGAVDRVNVESERVARLIIARAATIHGKDKVKSWI